MDFPDPVAIDSRRPSALVAAVYRGSFMAVRVGPRATVLAARA